jgi:predicted NBD/HSP70 family sugar kinase
MNILFDIGGTNMRVAAGRDSELGEIKKVPTPQGPKEAMATFVLLAKELSGGEKINRIVGSCRGRIVDGVLISDKLLSQWAGLRVADELQTALGAPVTIGHDTSYVGLGEVHRGAGRGSSICVYYTISSGVGSARIVDGEIDRGTYNPEAGRALINGEQLEDLVSGTAVQKKFGIHPKELASIDERNKLADILAVALSNMVLHWSPDTIVLGGSMIVGVNPIPLERIEKSLSELVLKTYPSSPVLKMAELGDNGGLVGAMLLAEQEE